MLTDNLYAIAGFGDANGNPKDPFEGFESFWVFAAGLNLLMVAAIRRTRPHLLRLDAADFSEAGYEYWGQISALKAGLVFAIKDSVGLERIHAREQELTARALLLGLVLAALVFALSHVPNRLMKERYDSVGSVLLDQGALVLMGTLFGWMLLAGGNLLLVVGIHALVNEPAMSCPKTQALPWWAPMSEVR